jgi:hypothetical protein
MSRCIGLPLPDHSGSENHSQGMDVRGPSGLPAKAVPACTAHPARDGMVPPGDPALTLNGGSNP